MCEQRTVLLSGAHLPRDWPAIARAVDALLPVPEEAVQAAPNGDE